MNQMDDDHDESQPIYDTDTSPTSPRGNGDDSDGKDGDSDEMPVLYVPHAQPTTPRGKGVDPELLTTEMDDEEPNVDDPKPTSEATLAAKNPLRPTTEGIPAAKNPPRPTTEGTPAAKNPLRPTSEATPAAKNQLRPTTEATSAAKNPLRATTKGTPAAKNPLRAEYSLELKGDLGEHHSEVKRLRRQRRRERLRLLWGWLAILSFVLSSCFLSVSKGFKKLMDTFHANEGVTYLIICGFYFSVIGLVIWTSRKTKFWQIQALLKFIITSVLPGLSLVAGSISKNDIWFFLFLMFTATCITFVLLTCETPEDYGITDMLVAIGMGFCVGPDGMGIWWKMIFGALPASSKAIVPIIVRYIHKNAKVEQGSIATDLEPSLREKKWKVASVTSEEAKEFLERLRAMCESVEEFDPRIQKLIDDVRRERSLISQEINNFRSRLENVA